MQDDLRHQSGINKTQNDSSVILCLSYETIFTTKILLIFLLDSDGEAIMVAFPYLNIQSNQRQARSSWSSKSQRIGETKSVGLTPVGGQTSFFFEDKVNIMKMNPVCKMFVGKAQKAKTSDGPNVFYWGFNISACSYG